MNEYVVQTLSDGLKVALSNLLSSGSDPAALLKTFMQEALISKAGVGWHRNGTCEKPNLYNPG
jgi:hypothetical protein